MRTLTMFLSICIPTHHGRAWCLKLAVDQILSQIEEYGLHDLVEISVSDNASQDETADVMAAAIARYPKNVRYIRMPMDCGLYNFLNAVRNSTGTYCWLFGSDDLHAPGSLPAAIETLKRFPGCSGLSSHYETYDFAMQHPVVGRAGKLYPVNMDVERQFTTFRDALTQLGPSQTFMSVQIFRRDLWDDAYRSAFVEMVYKAPNHLHACLISRILKADPGWVWTPQKLVYMRSDNPSTPSLQQSLLYKHSLLVLREMVAVWSSAAGDDRETFRSVLRKVYLIDWGPTAIRHNKMLKNQNARADFDLLVGYTRYLAALPEFWLICFPCLLIPNWFWKLSNSSGVLPILKKKILGR